jgi:hypothetical protein
MAGTSPPQTPRCYHQLTTRLYRPRAPADSIRPCLSARGSPVCQIWRDRRAGLLDPTRMAASLTGRVLAATVWQLNGAQAFCSLLPWLLLPPGFVPARTAAPRWAGASERTVRGAAEESQWRDSGTASLSFRKIASGIIPVVYPCFFIQPFTMRAHLFHLCWNVAWSAVSAFTGSFMGWNVKFVLDICYCLVPDSPIPGTI